MRRRIPRTSLRRRLLSFEKAFGRISPNDPSLGWEVLLERTSRVLGYGFLDFPFPLSFAPSSPASSEAFFQTRNLPQY